MKLKNALINYRSEKILTQEEVANQTGLSIATIIKVEKGESVSTLSKAKIANYLGIDLEDIED